MKPGILLAAAIALGLLVALLLFLESQFPGTLSVRENQVAVVWQVTVLAAIVASVAVALRRQRLGAAVRAALAWIALALVLVVGYSYWDELAPIVRRVGGNLVPAEPRALAPGMVALRAGAGGQFHVLAEINGQRVQLLVDTGASDVALTRADAQRVGIDVDRLVYDVPYRTANGVGYGARVRLDRVAVGDIVVDDVPGSVGGNLGQSLLGMTFLRRLSGFEVRGNELILRQ
jgi:aspartyl protease family protein